MVPCAVPSRLRKGRITRSRTFPRLALYTLLQTVQQALAALALVFVRADGEETSAAEIEIVSDAL